MSLDSSLHDPGKSGSGLTKKMPIYPCHLNANTGEEVVRGACLKAPWMGWAKFTLHIALPVQKENIAIAATRRCVVLL